MSLGRIPPRVSCKVAVLLACLLSVQFVPAHEASAGSSVNGQELVKSIFGAIVGAAIIANAQKSWGKVDPNVRDCLATQYGIAPNQLIQQGITAEDQRVAPYVQSCAQAVAQAILKQQEEQRALEAQQAAAEKARQDQLAAEAAAEAQKKAHHEELVAKYGIEMADAITAGQVRVGMTKDEVLAARGNPDKTEAIPPSDELWQYGPERIAISNGKVTYIGH